MDAPFTVLEHPADLGIEARGTSLVEAFQNAAIGLMSVILDLSTVEPQEQRVVALSGSDHKQLVVKWLSEILYLYDGQDFVCKEFTVHRLTSSSIDATVRGELFNSTKHTTRMDVKAVTYHQLVVRENDQGGLIRVFLDI
jgi:SHS2 domain-containing protein